MPRSPRIEYEGALYHVMSRGDRREAIFEDDRDREIFLKTLEETCERAGFEVCSYVLMGNHYHLLLETPQGNLVAGMRWLQSTYTARFNARHRLRGHVFSGRYKALPVETESGDYARTVSDYIHLNPARAGIVNAENPQLEAYRWSSFPRICDGKPLPAWLSGDRVLAWHGWIRTSRRGRKEYADYVQRRAEECWTMKNDEDAQMIRRGWFIGGEDFREKLEELAQRATASYRRESFAGPAMRLRDESEAQRLLDAGLQAINLELDELQVLKKNDPRKQGLSWLVKNHTVVGDEWIRRKLEMGHRSNISRAVSVFREAKTVTIKRLKRKLHKCTD